ncbi:glycosyltransferase [Amphritea sp. 1_MG-2023]|uniref:glycosyltransferase n=1 Tax=Amphritea sp. 1_MG-2023 TaxID=3062670 RepID=UPI0026E38755|nr:glycosyltransferase [Amphritea sp. 1_MG-2023]MDO6563441.1 glycosyltransferase [Amphritea sp. 1_MG-2023]
MKPLSIAVVIPVGPSETTLAPMLQQLAYLQSAEQIIFVFCPASVSLRAQLPTDERIITLTVEAGRAAQMNAGAQRVNSEFIWFLHLDSQFSNAQWQMLKQSLRRAPTGLHYFNLRFLSDGRGPMWLNRQGANLRSRCLRLPFGDQGFCLAVDQFKRLGGYPLDAPYGEDHLFVWQAHHGGIALINTGATLTTSARKYSTTGWLKLTLRYQFYWLKQATPQVWLLLKAKMF